MLERRQGTARASEQRAKPYSTNRTPLAGAKSESAVVRFHEEETLSARDGLENHDSTNLRPWNWLGGVRW